MTAKQCHWALRGCLYLGVCLCFYLYVLLAAGRDFGVSEPDHGLLSWLFPAERDAVVQRPAHAPAEFQPDVRMIATARRIEADGKRRDYAEAMDKEVSALRADLASPWSSLIVALRADCSCTGSEYRGFRIRRAGGAMTVAPWAGGGFGPEILAERTGAERPLTQPELERVRSEAALFYLAASLSVTPAEKAGPYPQDGSAADIMAWRQRHLAAGGNPEGGDQAWIYVRVATPAGLKPYNNRWNLYDSREFEKWISSFGTLPQS